ncbi:unnamed protein product [Durusdinium trenchii]|uniref:Heat shock 70 kDa protein n=2 Tax=Durusdinium trenchii TaxID=1381693 RepID=A0ABP0KW88_9DINO
MPSDCLIWSATWGTALVWGLAEQLPCWEGDHVAPWACCPMNDDTHSCFSHGFTHAQCCHAEGAGLSGCGCKSLYLREVATFLSERPREEAIAAKEVRRFRWRFHPAECSTERLWIALRSASRQADQCSDWEKLHFIVLCGLQAKWWQSDELPHGRQVGVDHFWDLILSTAVKLLSAPRCAQLLTPQEAYENFQRFDSYYTSSTSFRHIADFTWHRALPASPLAPPAQLHGHRTGRPAHATAAPSVHCSVLARLPEDRAQVRAAAATWGRSCDLFEVYVARPADRAPGAWTGTGSSHRGDQVVNLAMEYPVMKVHPDQRGGSKLSPSMQSRRFQTTNLIRKTLAMWHFVGSRSTEENGRFADFVCRLDPDTLFLAERFRRFVQQQGLDRESMVYFGQVHHFMRGLVGYFPDGGAGICLPARALEAFTYLLGFIVHVYSGGNRSKDLPSSCQMLPGHLDDVVTGLCFQKLNLLPHPALVTPLGQNLFNSDVLPRDARSTLGRVEDWSRARRMHHLFQCLSRCVECNCQSLDPKYWVDEKLAISFHGYKNASQMRLAYRYLTRQKKSCCVHEWNGQGTGEDHCHSAKDASEAAPYYTGSCVAEACPENSEGLDLGSGCSCKAGYSGTISPTQAT